VLFLLPALAVWVAGVAFLCNRTGVSWSSNGAGAGVLERRFGLYAFVTVRQEPVTFRGATGPGLRTEWQWHGPGALFTALALAALTAGVTLAYRHAVASRLLAGRCDECGYDLRARTGDRCPECGASLGTASAA
jgi:hypothetical protein